MGVSAHGGVCPWGCLPMGVSAHGGVFPWGCLLGVCIPACTVQGVCIPARTQQGIGVCIPACTGHRGVYPSMYWAVGVCLGVSAKGGCLLMGVSAWGVCWGCMHHSMHWARGFIPAWIGLGCWWCIYRRGCVCPGRVSAQGVSTWGICPGMAAWGVSAWGGFLPKGCSCWDTPPWAE